MQPSLTRQQLIHLFEQRQPYYARGEGVMMPKQFFAKWIPRKYGIPIKEISPRPYQCPLTQQIRYLTYRQACIVEIRFYFTQLQPITIDKSWGKDFEKCPHYIPPFLFLLDLVYEVQMGLILSSNEQQPHLTPNPVLYSLNNFTP